MEILLIHMVFLLRRNTPKNWRSSIKNPLKIYETVQIHLLVNKLSFKINRIEKPIY